MPRWLADRMATLGCLVTEAITLHYGREEFLRRLGHPFWFQAFGAVMGMDWHSSGITTSVMGALKRGLRQRERELGLFVCGGRGRHSKKTPAELVAIAERTGLDGEALARTSRLVAKVDSAAVQDGFALYLHSFVVADDGRWTVVQQGMSDARGQARRYHWISEGLSSFVDEPHSGIDGTSRGQIINLTDRRAARSREAQVALCRGNPDAVVATLRQLRGKVQPAVQPHLQLPGHHEVQTSDVVLRRLQGTLAAAAERGPKDFGELLLTPGVGARTVESLALVSEVVHGAPCRFSDPARFSYAHGGKDGHPFPVPLRVYDETIRVLRDAVARGKLGREERLAAVKKLDEQARILERTASGEPLEEIFARERRRSHEYGGMTVMGAARPPRPHKPRPTVRSNQLELPGLD